jgi:hypothetical protein
MIQSICDYRQQILDEPTCEKLRSAVNAQSQLNERSSVINATDENQTIPDAELAAI